MSKKTSQNPQPPEIPQEPFLEETPISNVDELKKLREKLGIIVKSSRTTAQAKKDMLAALRIRLGIVTSAAAIAGIGRRTHYEWIDEKSKTYDSNYQKAVEDIKEMQIDFAESQLFKNIQAGKEASNIFYLRCQAKSRGYIQSDELLIGNVKGEAFNISTPLLEKILKEEYGHADMPADDSAEPKPAQ